MGLIADLLTIGYIFILLFILFTAPFILPARKLLGRQGLTFNIFTAMCSGMFFTVIIIIGLAYVEQYTIWRFLAIYIALIIIVHMLLYRTELSELRRSNRLGKLPAILWSNFKINLGGFIKSLKTKTNKFPIPVFILIISLVTGFYLRLSLSLTHNGIFKPDAFGHLYLIKVLNSGRLFGDMTMFNDYPRGFHTIASFLNQVSALDTFTLMKFLGGIFGVLSIIAVYTLISIIHNKYSGALAALIYSLSIFDYTNLYRVQSHTTPEIMGFIISPIIILFAYLALTESRTDLTRSKRYLLMTVCFSILVIIIHPLSFLLIMYLILIMAVLASCWYTRFDMRIILMMVIIILAFIIPPMWAESIGLINWGASVSEILSVKRILLPSYQHYMVLALAFICSVYGCMERKFSLVFISFCVILLGAVFHTGIFITPIHPVGRSLPFFAMSASWLVAVASVEFISKLEVALKPFTKRSRNKLDKSEVRGVKGKTSDKRGGNRFTGNGFSVSLKAKRLSVLCFAIYLLTLFPIADLDYEYYEYDANIQPALKIIEEYPLDETIIYSARTFMVNFERTIIEPEGKHRELKSLLRIPAESFIPERPYTFIFVENSTLTLQLMHEGWDAISSNRDIMYWSHKWIRTYMDFHENIMLYYESPTLEIYLIYTKTPI
ncbi:MAG: hypothetical protein JSV49_04250 [Thermoplasmata archaeon]|nr:MAG: hypothetical protein JSV49_04250 [Thermoplasmata archaeon]